MNPIHRYKIIQKNLVVLIIIFITFLGKVSHKRVIHTYTVACSKKKRTLTLSHYLSITSSHSFGICDNRCRKNFQLQKCNDIYGFKEMEKILVTTTHSLSNH